MIYISIILAVCASISSFNTIWGHNVLGSLEGCKNGKCNSKKYNITYVLTATLSGGTIGIMLAITNIVADVFINDNVQLLLVFLALLILLFLHLINRNDLLPTGNFAVPSEWIKQGDYRSATIWGIILGMGIITYQSGPLFHAYIISSIFVDPWWFSIVLGLLYGFLKSFLGVFTNIRRQIMRATLKGTAPFANLITLISLISSILMIVKLIK